ncbi:MFS transporter [Mycolicibacterium agri]|uniref:MFS transporter n=1 Tax=Mycolicibacterium agri TaxID=36811 RepID=A0A7I9WC89_MYCAG|nr:MFS transporter [Mycolicibacterium agri]GFG55059.1 MFS transporter [Mycolicibacterium agri]
MKRYLTATFASLQTRNYRLYFLGQSVSLTGTWMQKMAQAWLVLELTNSGAWLGITLAAQQVPLLLLGPWGGLVADRIAKRTILIGTAVAAMVPSLLLGVLILTNHINVALVLVLAVIGGVIDALDKPARQSFPSEMVPASQLANAVVLNNIVQDTGKVVGPALGGILIAAFGLPWTFLLNAMSFLAVLAGLLLMRSDELSAPEPIARGAGQLRAGLAYIRNNAELFVPLALLASVGLVAYNFQLLLAVLGRETFHGDARTVGYLLGALGAGSVLGGLALAGVLRATVGRIIGAALLLAALLLATGVAPNLATAFVLVFAMGTSSVIFKALASTWLQLAAAPEMRGRVLSLLVVAIGGTTPIGAPVMGWLAEHFGTRATFLLAGVLTAIAAVIAYLYMRRAVGADHDEQTAVRSNA